MKTLIFSLLTLAAAGLAEARPCTRVVYAGQNCVATGRTLDWRTPIPTSLRVMPRGRPGRSFDVDSLALHWRARYGSIVAIGYDMGVSEGLNERGLAVNILYQPGARYTLPSGSEHRRVMSSSVWALYLLDNFATTAEAVAALSRDEFHLDAPAMADGSATTIHLAMTDSLGVSAVVEYVDGRLCLYHGREYGVLTNAPTLDRQMAVCAYWQSVGGMNMLPGTARSSDRFVRAEFYRSLLPDTLSHSRALAATAAVVRNCAVPMGIAVEGQPEISTTQWLSLMDQRRMVYYFRLTQSPSAVWIDLRRADLEAGSPQQTVTLTADGSQSGDLTPQLRQVADFRPVFRLSE